MQRKAMKPWWSRVTALALGWSRASCGRCGLEGLPEQTLMENTALELPHSHPVGTWATPCDKHSCGPWRCWAQQLWVLPQPRGRSLSLGHIPGATLAALCVGSSLCRHWAHRCQAGLPFALRWPSPGSFVSHNCQPRTTGESRPAHCPRKPLATPVTQLPGADLRLRAARIGRPALFTTVTRKHLPPDPALKVTHVRAWEAALGPPEGPGERQGQVRALMTAGQGVHSASRPGILSPAGHLGLQVPLSVHLPATKSSSGPLGSGHCVSSSSFQQFVGTLCTYEALRNKSKTQLCLDLTAHILSEF